MAAEVLICDKPAVVYSHAAEFRPSDGGWFDPEDRTSTIRQEAIPKLGDKPEVLWNLTQNWRKVIHTPGYEGLRGIFAGQLGVVLASGPSVDRTIPVLKEHWGKYVLVGTPGAYGPMRVGGLAAHLVPLHEPFGHLKFKQTWMEEPAAVVEYLAHPFWWELPVRRRFSFCRYETVETMKIQKLLGRVPPLKVRSSTIALMFSLARLMGCNPIVFVGCDFAFTDGLYHSRNHQIDDETPKLSHGQYLGSKFWDTKDIHGGKTRTSSIFIEQRNRLAVMIQDYRKIALRAGVPFEVVNATGTGIGIPDIPNVDLGWYLAERKQLAFDPYRRIDDAHIRWKMIEDARLGRPMLVSPERFIPPNMMDSTGGAPPHVLLGRMA